MVRAFNVDRLVDGNLLIAAGLLVYFGPQALGVESFFQALGAYSALAALLVVVGAGLIVVERFGK